MSKADQIRAEAAPKTLEIIVDTCTQGRDIVSAVGSLIQQLHENQRTPYANFMLTIPIQIGTEVKQRIFKEYFDAELEHLQRDGKTDRSIVQLDAFSSTPQTHGNTTLNVVETNASWAYKLLFAHKALTAVLSDTSGGLLNQLNGIGNLLRARFSADGTTPPAITPGGAFTRAELEMLDAHVLHAFEEFEQESDVKERELRDHHPHFASLDMDAHLGGRNDPLGEQIVRAEIRELMAGKSKALFDGASSQRSRFLLQSLFSTDAVQVAIRKADSPENQRQGHTRVQDLALSRFGFNMGDHSIIESVYDMGRGTATPQPLQPDSSILITDDKGLHLWMDTLAKLRKDRPVFTVNGYGFGKIMGRMLGDAETLGIADADVVARKAQADALTHGYKGDARLNAQQITTARHCTDFLLKGQCEGYEPWVKSRGGKG